MTRLSWHQECRLECRPLLRRRLPHRNPQVSIIPAHQGEWAAAVVISAPGVPQQVQCPLSSGGTIML